MEQSLTIPRQSLTIPRQSLTIPRQSLWDNHFLGGNIEATFSKIKISMCSIIAYFYRSDFQSKNFSYAIFIVKKRPLYVNFSIHPCGNL
jgi:hypothetical protein